MISLRALRTAAWALATVTAGAAGFHSALAAPTGARQPLRPGTHKVLVDQRVSGVRRSYYVHVPAGHDGTTPLPVVVALHGAFSTAREFERESGFSLLADRESFIVVYPQGIGLGDLFRHWNSGHCCGKARKMNLDDVGFVLAAVDDERLGVVARLHGVAEDATGRLCRAGYVGVAPRGPEIIHRKGRVADGGRGLKLKVPGRLALLGWTAEAAVPT